MANRRGPRRGAGAHPSANNVDGAAGQITYTQWLNEGGSSRPTSPSPSSTTRIFLGVAHTAHRHVETWTASGHAPAMVHFFVTGAMCVFTLRSALTRGREAVTSEDLSNAVLPVARGRFPHWLRVRVVRAHHVSRRARLLSSTLPRRRRGCLRIALLQVGVAFGLRHVVSRRGQLAY